MLKYFLAILSFILFFSCSGNGPLNNRDEDIELITKLLDKQAKAYREMDANLMMEIYIQDSSTVAAGTKPGFVVRGWEQIKDLMEKDFQSNWEMVDYQIKNPRINFHKDIAWVMSDAISKMRINLQGQDYKVKTEFRMLGILKKIDSQWKFALTNFQEFGASPESE